MDENIDLIRASVANGATDETKLQGADACRAVLAALDARHGEPLASTQIASSPIATTFAALRGVPPDQLLDLVIAKLRSKVPAESASTSPASAALRFFYLPIPGKSP